jgi:hypothetical protein
MIRFAALALSILAVGGAFAQDKSAATAAPKAGVAMEDPRPGDFWVYERRDEITGKLSSLRKNIITEVTPTEISVRFTTEGKDDSGGLNVYDRAWNIKMSGPWKYTPHDGTGIKSPLQVGESWKFQSDDVNPGNGAIWKRSGQSKVVGREAITTKAGTFDTFRVETVMARHPTNDPTMKTEVTWRTWFAPAINHWVKRTFVVRANGHLRTDETLELVEYGRKE